tara:strand:- start:131 stop:580 length:450 start_codon:yes stop_codon:yes gene_type:complete
MDLIKSLGHSSIDKELQEFSENDNMDPATRASDNRKKRFNEKPTKEKPLEEQIEDTKMKLMHLEQEREDDEENENIEEEINNLKDEKKSQFGKALHSTASVVTMWNRAKSPEEYRNAIRLFKMYEAVSFKNAKDRKLFHNLMLRSRRLF